MITKNELQHIIADTESYCIERTTSTDNADKFCQAICAFFIETSVAQKRPIPVSVLREETVSKYPYWATRELLMNAVMHRDYETNAPVQFYEYDDRIEVLNPGGLYGKVSPDNFPNVSDYRNPYIAEAIKILGYVNRFSRGIYRVQKELVENGNGEAKFDFSLITAFRVIENVSIKYFELGFGTEDYPEKAKENYPEKAKEKDRKKPKKIQDKILNIIGSNSFISVAKLAKLIGQTKDSTRYRLRLLTNNGVIKHEGSKKAGKWIIIKN